MWAGVKMLINPFDHEPVGCGWYAVAHAARATLLTAPARPDLPHQLHQQRHPVRRSRRDTAFFADRVGYRAERAKYVTAKNLSSR
jgi:hypothetical protein